MKKTWMAIMGAALLAALQDGKAETGTSETYAQKNGEDLKVQIVLPPGAPSKEGKRPGVIFYHGGGWQSGGAGQFYYWANLLAKRGFVVFCPQYRLVGKNGSSVVDCVEDARDVYQWIMSNADRWNLDTGRMIIGGGSAGGHLALVTLNSVMSDPQMPKPVGCLLFNPVVDTTQKVATSNRQLAFAEHPELNPMSLLHPGLPPMLIFHGEADRVVPVETVRAYMAAQAKQGSVDVQLATYPGEAHSFFNPGKAKQPDVLPDLNAKTVAFAEKCAGMKVGAN